MKKKIFLLLCTFSVMSFACEPNANMIGFCSHPNGKPQEDTYAIEKMGNNIFCGVYDGNGGPEASGYLRDNLHVFFKKALLAPKEVEIFIRPVERAFIDSFYDVEEYIISQKKEVGASALAVYLQGNKAHIAWVGTVCAVLECDNNVLFATKNHTLSEPDNPLILNSYESTRIAKADIFREYFPELKKENSFSPVGSWLINGFYTTRFIGHPWAKGRLSSSKAFNNPLRNTSDGQAHIQRYSGEYIPNGENTWIVTPRIGQILAEPEYREITLTEKNHWFIIASDGLASCMKHKEMIDVVNYYYMQNVHCLNTIASKLVKMAIERGSTKNISIIIIDLLASRM